MSAENPKYWGLEGDKRLTCTTIEERMEELHEDCEGNLGETVEIVGYDPMVIDEKEQARFAAWVLESLLVNIDESEFGGEDYTSETPVMKEAAAEFIKKIVAEYKVWPCDEVCRKTVKVADYIDVE